MRQGVKEWQNMECVVTGANTDFRDMAMLKEVEEQLQRDTYLFGEGRKLAKNGVR